MANLIVTLILSFSPAAAFAQNWQINELFPHAFVDDSSSCRSWSDEISPAQRAVIEQTMSQHEHRLFHLLWHATRNGWAELSAQERAVIQRLSPQWGLHAPLCPSPTQNRANLAGEEFLLMHHLMIDQLRVALISRGLPCIRGWRSIPQAQDPQWPMPPGAADDSSKSAEIGRLIESWSRVFMDPNFLRAHSLSEVGYLLEYSIHNNMHMRWAAQPKPGDDYSPLTGATTSGGLLTPSPFDAPTYNWLGNPFSSAVNPVFWKLHGYVDEVIAAWLRAQPGVYMAISSNCGGRQRCYQWKSRWTGGQMHRHEPVGGGRAGAAASSRDPALERSLQKILPTASFRNRAFDQFLNEPRAGAGPGEPRAPDPIAELVNPVIFVERFGPCR